MHKSPHALAKFMEVRSHEHSHEFHFALTSLEKRPSGVDPRNIKRATSLMRLGDRGKSTLKEFAPSISNKEEGCTLPISKFRKENHQSTTSHPRTFKEGSSI